MNTKLLLPLCAAVALVTACGSRDDGQSGVHSDSSNGTGVAADPAPSGTMTPPADTTAPGTTPSDTPASDTPASDTPPGETSPSNPPNGGQ